MADIKIGLTLEEIKAKVAQNEKPKAEKPKAEK